MPFLGYLILIVVALTVFLMFVPDIIARRYRRKK